MNRFFIAAALGVLSLVIAPTAFACSCAPPPPAAQAAKDAPAIFVGKVTATRMGGSTTESVVTFTITDGIHGVKKGESVLFFQESMCGYEFAKGKSYLVYAGLDNIQRFNASICSRTKPATGITKELKALRSLPKRAFRAPARVIKPISDNGLGCIEMYSACFETKSGENCTSAPFTLPCGESGQVPGGDLIRCVCAP